MEEGRARRVGDQRKQEVGGLALSGGGSAALPAVRRSRGAVWRKERVDLFAILEIPGTLL